MEPPEVKHERLLVVSILGFLVNLVGIFVFQVWCRDRQNIIIISSLFLSCSRFHSKVLMVLILQHGGAGHGHSHDGGHGHSHDGGHGHSHGGGGSQIMQVSSQSQNCSNCSVCILFVVIVYIVKSLCHSSVKQSG